jgi:glycosyltransferase involved in cell wall biosynthesis
MSHSPFFTIITPTYNRAHFLASTIQSVLGQQFQDWEYIIVDDGSTDDTKEVLKSYPDPRIRYVYQENQERSAARNRGIKEAKGKYICFLDSDDTFEPQHLSKLGIGISEKNEPVAFFATGINFFIEGEFQKRSIIWDGIQHPILFVWENFLFPGQVCIHAKCFKEHWFPIQFSIWEDTHLWLRLLAQFPFFHIPVYTVNYHQHGGGTVQSTLEIVEMKNVNRYLAAIDDLFFHHESLLSPFLSEKMRRDYELEKILLFQGIATSNNQKKIAWVLLLQAMKKKNHARIILVVRPQSPSPSVLI